VSSDLLAWKPSNDQVLVIVSNTIKPSVANHNEIFTSPHLYPEEPEFLSQFEFVNVQSSKFTGSFWK
jgi:hypothetical protein